MSKIVIGEANGKNIGFDIQELLPTRLLVQANSGGGKSWLLRRLAEQLFGEVQTIILDPEGEFFTLREKFGYVLVGEGGETPADVRSAALLAQKFMELKVSAVCDLFEAFRSRPMERRQWVRLFLNALLEVPRSQWSPLVVIIDEAHKFCPQETPKAGSQQEREIIAGCKDAMIALATTGRKRGFCPVWATQRLAKLDKDASAELFNRLVGMTIEDVDVDRAADLMSVSREDKQAFRVSLRTLNPGQFYAFGRAVCKVRTLITVGGVETRHPESGKAARYSEPPPMPEAVAKLLPKLADLPKEAEDKARTEAEYKREIRELRMKVKTAERAQSAATTGKAVVPDPRAIERALTRGLKERDIEWMRSVRNYQREMEKRANEATRELVGQIHAAPFVAPDAANVTISEVAVLSPVRVPAPRPQVMRQAQAPSNANGADLSGSQVRVLSRLVELMEYTASESVRKEQLAAWSEYSPNSGGFNNYLGGLRTAGMIHYPQPGMVAITDEGRKQAVPEDVPATSEEMLGRAKRVLGGSEARLLEILHVTRETTAKTDLAEAAGFSPNSGGFNNYLGHMRTLGFIEYPQPGQVKCADWLYLNGDAV